VGRPGDEDRLALDGGHFCSASLLRPGAMSRRRIRASARSRALSASARQLMKRSVELAKVAAREIVLEDLGVGESGLGHADGAGLAEPDAMAETGAVEDEAVGFGTGDE